MSEVAVETSTPASEAPASTGSLLGGGSAPSPETPSEAPAPTPTASANDMDWRARMSIGLPDEDRELFINEASRSASETDFAKRFIEQRRQISKSITVPPPDDKAGWDSVYNKLGRPETPDKYELKWEGAPEALTDADRALFDEAKPVFHRHGLRQEGVNEFVKLQEKQRQLEAETMRVRAEDMEQKRLTELKAAWGGDFEQNKAIYANTVGHYMGAEDMQTFAELRLSDLTLASNHPVIARALTKVGRERANDDFDFTPINASRKEAAADQLKSKQAELVQKGITFGHPDYPTAEMERLYQQVGSTRPRTPGTQYKR